jgi:hypothetical protein
MPAYAAAPCETTRHRALPAAQSPRLRPSLSGTMMMWLVQRAWEQKRRIVRLTFAKIVLYFPNYETDSSR